MPQHSKNNFGGVYSLSIKKIEPKENRNDFNVTINAVRDGHTLCQIHGVLLVSLELAIINNNWWWILEKENTELVATNNDMHEK